MRILVEHRKCQKRCLGFFDISLDVGATARQSWRKFEIFAKFDAVLFRRFLTYRAETLQFLRRLCPLPKYQIWRKWDFIWGRLGTPNMVGGENVDFWPLFGRQYKIYRHSFSNVARRAKEYGVFSTKHQKLACQKFLVRAPQGNTHRCHISVKRLVLRHREAE